MAKTKQSGKTRQHATRSGKRLGIKMYGGQAISIGQIIVRQRGSKYHAGNGVGTGRDHTLFALKEGTIKFSTKHGKSIVSIN